MRRNLFVVKNMAIAEQLQKIMGENWRVVGTGCAMMGEPYDYALVSHDWTHASRSWDAQEWLDTSVRTRVFKEIFFL